MKVLFFAWTLTLDLELDCVVLSWLDAFACSSSIGMTANEPWSLWQGRCEYRSRGPKHLQQQTTHQLSVPKPKPPNMEIWWDLGNISIFITLFTKWKLKQRYPWVIKQKLGNSMARMSDERNTQHFKKQASSKSEILRFLAKHSSPDSNLTIPIFYRSKSLTFASFCHALSSPSKKGPVCHWR